MTSSSLADVLRQTFDDRHLSRTERRALAERISGAALDDEAVSLQLHHAFELAATELKDGPSRDVLGWIEEVVKAFRQARRANVPRAAGLAEVLMSPGELCVRKITSLLSAARISADICVFTITDDRISRAIREAHARGVQVRIVTDNEKAFDTGSDTQALAAGGIPVRVDDSPFHMHHKFALFDGTTVLTGSYNWTRGAASSNQENLIVSDDQRFVRPFAEEFRRLWEAFAPRS